jgi:YfiH family protein
VAVRTAFTSRHGGVSVGAFATRNLATHVGDEAGAVAANRRALADDLRATRIVFMQQVHGTDVMQVAATSPTEVAEVDALVTDLPGIAIAVLVADCVPVIVAGHRAAAVVHAGRRGVQHGVVSRALSQLRDLDDGPLRAWLGPAICGGCYEVPAQMQVEVATVVPPARVTTTRGTPGLDLRAGVLAQLRDADVTDVHVDATCTAEDPAYFSYRRDGVTGRFAGTAIIDP